MNATGIWVRGLAAAFISGGASGVTGGITASVIDPNTFNLTTQLTHTLTLIGVTFIVSGILGTCAYLTHSPLGREKWTDDKRNAEAMKAAA
jgi:hypothetical protein